MLPVLFRVPRVAPIDHTTVGPGIRHRRPLRHRRLDLFRQLLGGPFLAAFDAGIYDMEMP